MPVRASTTLQLELGSESSAFRGTYREWLGPKISKSKFLKYFLETTFLYNSCFPDHYEPKIFFLFSSKYSFGPKIIQKIFKVFLETTFVHVSCYPDHNEPKIFFGFQSPDWRVPFNVRLCPLMNQKTRPLSSRIQKRTGHRRTRVPLCYAISEGRPPLCNTSPSESANVRPSPPMSILVRKCPSESANVRPRPPMSVNVRQCPKKHVRCLIESKKDRT